MLLDRITGQTLISMPDQVHSGRYRVLEPMVLNRHIRLQVGDLLCSDGSDRCQLDEGPRPFVTMHPELEAEAFQFTRAIGTLSHLIDNADSQNSLVSPLLPATVVSDQSRASVLEQLLEEVLEKGSLDRISIHPRMDLKYEEEVADVSRARRLANRSLTHLASHSECWQRVTFDGVQPRKVLARFSEDDYNTYENRVYARLLDDIENHLKRRLGEVNALRRNLDDALNLTRGDIDLHHLTSDTICTLWADALWNAEEVDQQLKATSVTTSRLTRQLQRIRALKRQGLYRRVPRSAHIGANLHRTNILSHDVHYRHLARLWDALSRERQQTSRKPDEVLADNQVLEERYSQYVGLVICHALVRYGMKPGVCQFSWAGFEISVHREALDWHIQVDGQDHLVLVPWVFLHDLPSLNFPKHPQKIVCWPGIGHVDDLERAQSDPASVCLTPMDLYTVERMGQILDSMLARLLLTQYGKPIRPVPTAVMAVARDMKELDVSGTSLKVLATPSYDKCVRLRQLLSEHASEQIANAVTIQLQATEALAECPVCSASAPLVPQPDGGFRSQCDRCGAYRYWYQAGSEGWKYRQLLGSSTAFRYCGRRGYEFVTSR